MKIGGKKIISTKTNDVWITKYMELVDKNGITDFLNSEYLCSQISQCFAPTPEFLDSEGRKISPEGKII